MAYVEVLIGGAAAFLLGAGWYTALFGKMWQAETGVTDEQAKSGAGMAHGLAFVMMCIISFNINFIINFHEVAEQTFVHGAFHGIMVAAFVAVPAVAIHYLYQRKSLKLFLIDAGYILAFCALSGGVMAALKFG